MPHRHKILIVDDEPLLCQSLKILLSDKAREINTCFSGQEAVSCLQEKEYDLVLLDWRMPEMDGFQLLDYLKAHHEDTLAIMMTGHASIDSAIEALKRGAHDYLGKPFEHEELLKRVENALNQKRLKKEKNIISAQLEFSEERYRYLVDYSPDIVFTLDGEGKFVFVNDTVRKLFGFNEKELIGKPFAGLVHEEDRDRLEDYLYDIREGRPMADHVEIRAGHFLNGDSRYSSDGEYSIIELRAIGVDGRFIGPQVETRGIYGIARDISERRRIEEEKRILENQFQQAQKLESIGTLAGGIAHDFNNLLMAIQGNASLILFNVDDGHPYYERLRNIEKLVDSGSRLTAQLLGYARKGKYEVKPLDLNHLAKYVSDTFGRTRKNVTVHHSLDPGLFSIEADSGQIEQVLMNLFVNASDAMPNGGNLYLETANTTHENLRGKLYNPRPGSYVLLSVRDTGHGIDESIIERIFEPFFTTKEIGRGTGLGLASTYGIVKGHDGFIDVESKMGEGTIFRIYLPASGKKVEETGQSNEQFQKGGETVLLIDDEEIIIDVGRSLLEAIGYKVFTAMGGKEALEIYSTKKDEIDIVLLDIVMPGIGGGELFDRLKKINPNIKILLHSGYAIEGEAESLMNRGCDGFIQKPFKVKDLSINLRKILDR
jgi:two-component system, cell cycle sensor histidine kinase and response regulator CckA